MGKRPVELLHYGEHAPAVVRLKPDRARGVHREKWGASVFFVASVVCFVSSRYQLKISAGVRWYNSRPYVPGTFNSKITDLPDLRHALERKCHPVPGLWD